MMPHCNVDITNHHLTLSAPWCQFTKILSKTSDLVFRPVSIDNLKHKLGIFLFWGILSFFSVNSLAITIQSVRRAAYSFVFVVFFACIFGLSICICCISRSKYSPGGDLRAHGRADRRELTLVDETFDSAAAPPLTRGIEWNTNTNTKEKFFNIRILFTRPSMSPKPEDISNISEQCKCGRNCKKIQFKISIEIQTQNEASIFFHLARTKARAPTETWRLVTTQV